MRARREACALPQGLLAERVGLSRQSVSAIEAGRATPGVDVALRLAQVLDCRVEDLFGDAPAAPDLQAEGDTSDARSGRVTLAHIGGRWVAHGLGPEGASRSADGLRRGGTGDTHTPRVRVTPLRPLLELQDNVVLMGCGAGLGLLADLLNRLPGAGRFVWLPRTSTAALAALHASPWPLLPLLSLPIAIKLFRDLRALEGAPLNATLAGTAKLLLLHGVLLAGGLVGVKA